MVDAAAVTPEDFDRAVTAEWQSKAALGGRTVADDRPSRPLREARPLPKARGRQLGLPFD